MPAVDKRGTRFNRRQALRMGAAVGAAGAGVAAGLSGPGSAPAPAQAQASAWKTMHLELDVVTATNEFITQAGSGPPQRGDWQYADGKIYAGGDAGGTQLGTYQCYGGWTSAFSDTGLAGNRLVAIQFLLSGRGSIMGMINEGSPDASKNLVGAVSGGTGDFTGALGTFQQFILMPPTPTSTAGRNQGAVLHGVFDLMLPNM